LCYQAVVLALIAAAILFLTFNTRENMRVRGIQTGFDFLGASAGFDISESAISFSANDTYGKALWVGVLNTVRVAIAGIVLSTLLGVAIGVGRFSRNGLVRGLCYGYVELFRNIPVLLQMIMWYLFFAEMLPANNQAWNVGNIFFLSKGGLAFPWPTGSGYLWAISAALCGLVAAWLRYRWMRRRIERAGRITGRLWQTISLVLIFALAGWLIGGMPVEWSVPQVQGFALEGGVAVSPEFLAVLISLTVYAAAFIAEVVRSGIQSVGRGQQEAATALGLPPQHTMRLVTLPQAMRVIVPPLTNQYLSLTKSSSLAVAIGYPDVVSIANTTINQTGRAVECVVVIMVVYLSMSLNTSLIMNSYNKRVSIKER
jgi:general L-amino acid transport system permease protein